MKTHRNKGIWWIHQVTHADMATLSPSVFIVGDMGPLWVRGKKRCLKKTIPPLKKKCANLLNKMNPLPPHTHTKFYDCYCMLLMALKSKFIGKKKNFF